MAENAMENLTIEQLVDGYVKARDRKAELKRLFDEKCAELDEWMDNAEAALLSYFNREGVTTARTAAGSAYRSTRTSARVADWQQTLGFIRENEQWHMLEQRVNKTAIEEHVTETGEVPPGVEIVRQHTVGVRRS